MYKYIISLTICVLIFIFSWFVSIKTNWFHHSTTSFLLGYWTNIILFTLAERNKNV